MRNPWDQQPAHVHEGGPLRGDRDVVRPNRPGWPVVDVVGPHRPGTLDALEREVADAEEQGAVVAHLQTRAEAETAAQVHRHGAADVPVGLGHSASAALSAQLALSRGPAQVGAPPRPELRRTHSVPQPTSASGGSHCSVT